MIDYDEQVTVSELTRAIRGLLEEGIGDVVVVGEVSNYKQHTSGHRYFTLKDSEAQIAAVMWRTRPLGFVPEDGRKVLAIGRLTVYPAQGKYQIDVTSLRPFGLGELYAALEKLKRELSARGWFNSEHKKPLPVLPATIAVVTSATGAALRDILSTIARRNPTVKVLVRPTLVQGEGSAEDVAKAIAECNRVGADVMIVGRGGGSIEDLWSFNTEIVAKAIYDSDIPVISAVGHETDTTIADFVADRRAATPTAAAELATPVTVGDLMAGIDRWHSRIMETVTERIDALRGLVAEFEDGSAARRIQENIIRNRRTIDACIQQALNTISYSVERRLTRIQDWQMRTPRTVEYTIRHRQQRIDDVGERIGRTLQQHIQRRLSMVHHASTLLQSLHPLAPLQRGYAVLEMNGAIVSPSEMLQSGDTFTVVRQAQRVHALATGIDSTAPVSVSNPPGDT